MSNAGRTCEYVLDPDDPDTWSGEEGDVCLLTDELNEDGLWTCPHSTEANEEFCVFHLPPSEKPDGFEPSTALTDALSKARNATDFEKQRRKQQFIGAKFDGLDLREETIEGAGDHPIRLDYSRFSGEVDFSRATVKQPLSLDGVTYEQEVTFRAVTFEHEFDHTYTACNGKVDFSNARFEARASFFTSKFTSDADFSRITNHSRLGFEKSEFHEDVTFLRANLQSLVSFSEVDFAGEVQFFEAYIGGDIDLDKVRFQSHVECSDAVFEGKTRFAGSTFEQGVGFVSAEFRDSVIFNGTRFRASPQLTGTTFGKSVSFKGSLFEGRADLGGEFKGFVDFSNAEFHSEVSLTGTFQNQVKCMDTTFSDKLRITATFEERADFGQSIFNGQVVFHVTERGVSDEVRSVATFESDVDFTRAVFNGQADFEYVIFDGEVVLRESSLTGASFQEVSLSGAKSFKADFTDVNLSGACLTGANLERALLNRTDLFGTNLEGAAFYGAVFGDAQINEQTEFGERCVYDPEFDDEPAGAVDDDGAGPLTKAAGQYRIIEQLGRTNAFPDMVSHNFIQRKDIHREQYRLEGRWGRLIRASASKYVLEYGENPWRLIATGLSIVVGFGILYPLVGGLEPTGGPPITANRVIDNPLLLAQSIYYSTLTFTTLGMGDFLPVGLGRVLTTLETSLGAIIMALLVFVFGRRAAR